VNAELLFERAAETPPSFSSFAEMAADLVTDHEAAKVTCKLKSAGKQARDHLAGHNLLWHPTCFRQLALRLGKIFSMSITRKSRR
jgi:hypothetical protein